MVNTIKKMARTALLFLAIALNACGGGGGGPSAGGSSTTSVYITDSPISGYSQVLVTILKAELRNTQTGTAVTLVDFSGIGGMTFDLTDLSGVLRLVNITNISVGTYDQIAVTLVNTINLRDSQGNLILARFDQSRSRDETYTLLVNVHITIEGSPTGILILDLDLSQFNYDPDTGIVQPALLADDSGNRYSSYGRLDKVEGVISAVNAGNERFTIILEHSQAAITVATGLETVCKINGNPPVQGSSCYQVLTAGQAVKVKGLWNPADEVIRASLVKADNRLSGSPAVIDKVEGFIGSVDTSNGTFTVVVQEVKGFVPVFNPDGTLTVRVNQGTIWDDLSGISDLVPQMGIEVYGNWDEAASELSAIKVDAEGQDEDEPNPPGPPPRDCSPVPPKGLSEYGVAMMPVFEVEDITLDSVSTGEDFTVTASNGQTYYLARETKLEQEPSHHICVGDLQQLIGREIEIKYGLTQDGRRVAFKLEVK